MEIGKEKAVTVPVSTLGLLMAMAGSAEWETENTKKVVNRIARLIDGVVDTDTGSELKAYIVAFGALEMQARGGDATEIIDGAQRTFGNRMLKRVLKKIEEIENVRKKRRNKE